MTYDHATYKHRQTHNERKLYIINRTITLRTNLHPSLFREDRDMVMESFLNVRKHTIYTPSDLTLAVLSAP